MEYVCYGVGLILLTVGVVGCIVPVLPGPILSYCALFCLIPTAACPSVATFVWVGILTVAVTIADTVVPVIGAKKFDCSKWGTWGCFIGTFVGMFFLPIGVVAGPFLGAFAGELIGGKDLSAAWRGGIGALLGFLAGTVLKLVVCAVIAAVAVYCLFYDAARVTG